MKERKFVKDSQICVLCAMCGEILLDKNAEATCKFLATRFDTFRATFQHGFRLCIALTYKGLPLFKFNGFSESINQLI